LEALARQPEALVGRIDWITKRWLFSQFIQAEGLPWTSPWLRAQDLEFHHVDPLRNLAWPLADPTCTWEPSDDAVLAAKSQPPSNTRAAIRSRVMRWLASEGRGCFVDWEIIDTNGVNPLMLLNPFDANPELADQWIAQVRLSSGPPPAHGVSDG